MDINLLVINLGNSRIALGAFVAGELTHTAHLAVDTPKEWAGAIADVWARLADGEQPAVAGVSVNPSVAEQLEAAVKDATGQDIAWVGRQIDLPITVKTEQPDQTGADRVVNIAAAYEQMGKACVVVDAGTAITIDVCDDQGGFLGGAIAPGVGMMLRSLHTGTARIPQIAFDRPAAAIGQNTEQAVRHGVFHGVRGMVKELVENYATHLGFWPDIIATGGDAERLFEDWELIHAVSPHLTLYGVALAYTEHHIKHGT